MFRLKKSFRFEASHRLPLHDGKCSRLHGHSWVLTVEVAGDKLHTGGPKTGMLCDFSYMSEIVKPLVESYLDHFHLNESLNLENPTSELVAQWVYENLKEALPNLYSITIGETCTSECVYIPSK